MKTTKSPLEQQVLTSIRQSRMVAPGDRVAVAVSGGADSVALLRLLAGFRDTLGITLLVAHFNHALREADSEGDAQFVADLARDLAGELGERGFNVVTHTTYRMIPVSRLPRDACDAFAANRIEAVLHYSRRSARAFLEAARAAGVEISALAIPQCCISDAVASVVRDAGAPQVMVARSPDENALFESLDRALRP